MQVEMKNTSFKKLVEYLWKIYFSMDGLDTDIDHILSNELKWQYIKAFKKYQNEEQKFRIGDNVKLKDGAIGRVIKVSRRKSGKYYYVVKYSTSVDYLGEKLIENGITNPLTYKNLVKVKRKIIGQGNTVYEEVR